MGSLLCLIVMKIPISWVTAWKKRFRPYPLLIVLLFYATSASLKLNVPKIGSVDPPCGAITREVNKPDTKNEGRF
jgi:hypothetical protein